MRKLGTRLALAVLASTWLFTGCNLLNQLQAPDDNAITSGVQAKLFEDSILKTRDIHVTSQNGVVSLSGSVATDLEKAAAERLAGQIKGVKSVVNQLVVSTSTAAATPTPEPATQTAEAQAPAPAPARRARSHRRAQAVPPAESAEVAPATSYNAPQPAPAAQAAPAPAAVAPPEPAPQPAPQPQTATIPPGTVVNVQMIDSIDSSRNRPGEEFSASVVSPIVVGNQVVVPQGSDARVRLVQATSAGHISGSSELQLELISLTVHGTTYAVQSGYYEQHGASRGKRSAEVIGGGAALGALIGAVIGKGKGAAIGAGVGAGAGTATQAATHGQQVKIPSETKLDFTLKAPVSVTLPG